MLKTNLAFLSYAIILILFLPSCAQEKGSDEIKEDQFRRNIRTTDPLSPVEEQQAFHLPAGFEVQLFAAEPDIAKPLNMSFDHKGRMWLTQSYEYPFPDTTGFGKDKVSILEDTDGDGSADKISVFADSLNIPIGIQTVPNGAIVYSIPNIWNFVDHNQDDKVDERKILYSGFKYGDTHGMVNNFVRSWDGWIHADHGFSNTSTVAGADGDTIVMQSGNTFRFRMDGSRVEFTTTGRVNPYGYAYDELGYTYSVDCHTSPVYQLIRGADYPHFGKKPTGIGFGPALMKHDYGSTALAGLEYYISNHFPPEYRQSFYYGDVVRSRVSRSNFQMIGTTPVIHQEEDFIISDDPWFRPVDVKLGPDGALYIADFYNRIIGHYEVPLDHPGRDRQRGRIWRVVYTGADHSASPHVEDFSELNLEQLIENLDDPNLPLRMAYADQIVDRFAQTAAPLLVDLIDRNTSVHSQIQALWILFRINKLNQSILSRAARHRNDTIKVHALRIFAEIQNLDEIHVEQARSYLNYDNPHVIRQAVMVVGQYPDTSNVIILLDLLNSIDRNDTHLFYSVRQSLRDQLRDTPVLRWMSNQQWENDDSSHLADVLRGVDRPLAARFLMHHLGNNKEPLENQELYATHAARWLPASAVESLVQALQENHENTSDEAYDLFVAMMEGLEASDKKLPKSGQAWARTLAGNFLKEPVTQYDGWKTLPIDRQPYPANPWELVDTMLPEEKNSIIFLSSNAMDGRGNGISIIQSPSFQMPENLTFRLRGRKNNPGEDQPASPTTNRVELVQKSNGTVWRDVAIDRLSVDTIIEWMDEDQLNKEMYFRIVDGSAAHGENIALGGFVPPVVDLPSTSPRQIVDRQVFAAKMAADYKLVELIDPLKKLTAADQADVLSRNAAASALLVLVPDYGFEAIKEIIGSTPHLKLKELLLQSISNMDPVKVGPVISTYLHEVPYQAQKEIVMNIGQSQYGIRYLFEAADRGELNPRLLIEPLVVERLRSNLTHPQRVRLDQLKSEEGPRPGEIDDLIDKRLRGYISTAYSTAKGRTFFSIYCSACHEINGQGGNIGPQLNGVGNWGARALSEKILDPNRNISQAFKSYVVKTKDDRVMSGLFRREEGQSVIFADAQGEEFTLNKIEIKEQNLSPYTVMPDHFRHTISEEDFRHLLAYLLSLK